MTPSNLLGVLHCICDGCVLMHAMIVFTKPNGADVVVESHILFMNAPSTGPLIVPSNEQGIH